LPALEDANAIQVSLMRVQKALIDDTISAKKAGLLLYSLQLAVTNVGQTTFGEAGDRELVTDVMDEEEALNNQLSGVSLEQNLFTAEDAERAKESGTMLPRMNSELPRMNSDGRGVEMEEVPKVVTMRM
jgi:hypothetical protein